MQYAALVRDAWRITWRYRPFWVLGLFAGGSVGVPALHLGDGGRLPSGDGGQQAQQAFPNMTEWAQANWGVLIGAGAAIALLALAGVLVSFVAQGAMAIATVDLAEGRPTTLRRAWTAGRHLFWRYVGLWTAMALIVVLVGGIAAALIAAIVALFNATGGGTPLGLVLAIALGVPAAVVACGLALVASIVVAYAQRIIALQNVGPWLALRAGTNLLRAHLGESLLVWVLNVGLSIGFGAVITAAVVGVLLMVGGVSAVVWLVGGLSTVLFGYMGIGLLELLAAGVLLSAISNTFFWNYWTLAYLQLTRPAVAARATA